MVLLHAFFIIEKDSFASGLLYNQYCGISPTVMLVRIVRWIKLNGNQVIFLRGGGWKRMEGREVRPGVEEKEVGRGGTLRNT